MEQPLYRLDEAGKVILIALKRCGKHKTFAQILDEAGSPRTGDLQVLLAINLESLGLIESVTYRLPIEIRAELSATGIKVANALEADTAKDDRSPRNISPNDWQFSAL